MGLIPDRFGLKDRTLWALIGVAAWLGTCVLIHACAINRVAVAVSEWRQ
jgi:hypothetical protein